MDGAMQVFSSNNSHNNNNNKKKKVELESV